MLVLDVSEHQGKPSLAPAKDAGYQAIIIRAGFNGRQDYSAAHFQAQARSLGMLVGHYFYLYSGGGGRAAEEFADWSNVMPGETMWLDCEDSKITAADVNSFLSRMDQLGIRCGIYSGNWWMQGRPWIDQFLANRPLWNSGYPDRWQGGATPPDANSVFPAIRGMRNSIWQFTDRRRVPGIGAMDCSITDWTTDQWRAAGFQGSGVSNTNIDTEEQELDNMNHVRMAELLGGIEFGKRKFWELFQNQDDAATQIKAFIRGANRGDDRFADKDGYVSALQEIADTKSLLLEYLNKVDPELAAKYKKQTKGKAA